jgi:ADP-ribosylglycohydrolase
MDTAIKAFEDTKAITDVTARTARRDALVNQLYAAACGMKGFDVDSVVKSVEHWGEVAAFMVAILAKLNDFQCYEGPLLTVDRLQCVLYVTVHASKYLRHMARTLITYFIQHNVLLKDEKQVVTNHMKSYAADDREGHAWVWECMLALCPNENDAFLGSMVGQCVGDALGFVVEGHGPETCQQFVKEFVDTETVPTWVRIKGLTFGQYSDDSQLARETYVSYVQASGKMDPAVYGNRIGGLFQPGHYRIVGYGKTTAKAGEALYLGKHHSTTGSKTTTGNGSAMRSAPIGLIMSQKPYEEIKHTASMFSNITHATEACNDGSIAIALGTRASMATRHVNFDAALFLDHIASHVTNVGYKTEVKNILNLLKGSDEAAKVHIASYGKRMGEDEWGTGISPGVLQSSLWALYSFCKYPNDYKKCIATSIACGGDVDSTAAMAGGLIGARVGFAAVPKIWRETIHDLDIWKLDDICELVNTVYDMVK